MAALQHGIPAVATSGSQTDPILRHRDGEAFTLCPESDVHAFADAVAALHQDSRKRRQMGQEAFHLYQQEFDWPILASRVEAFLNRNSAPAPKTVLAA